LVVKPFILLTMLLETDSIQSSDIAEIARLEQRVAALRAVQRMAGSGPGALAPILCKMQWPDLAGRAARIRETEKDALLLSVLARHVGQGDKVVAFTGFRATLDHLARLAGEAGIATATYHGSLSRADKDAAIGRFADEVPVLLTTEAAGEGRNLQFCHVMVNFDLPWNPMRIEQRLGRIHRIGQRRDVRLTNLVTRGTIEDRILRVLEAKINLFELVVGEIGAILGEIDEQQRSRVASVGGCVWRLRALDPFATLERGYAMVERRGKVVSSVSETKPGAALGLRMKDGSVAVHVDPATPTRRRPQRHVPDAQAPLFTMPGERA